MPIETAHPRHAHVPSGRGRILRILDERIEVKLAERDTAGADAVFEVRSPPGSGPPVLHTHPPQETFYVLEGEFEVYGAGPDGPYAVRATAGDGAHVPGGVQHGDRNAGDRAGRVLAIFEPPWRMRELFEALDGRPEDRLLEIAAQHGLGPPGASLSTPPRSG